MTPLLSRLLWAHENIISKPCPFAIVWDDPERPDTPARVTIPTDSYWAFLLHGGIVPPVSVWRDKDHIRVHYAGPIGQLTREQAMRYVLEKDVPRHVWSDSKRNARAYQILPRDHVPKDRSKRDHWILDPATMDIGLRDNERTAEPHAIPGRIPGP